MSDREEANTVLALELDEKVERRVAAIVNRMLNDPTVLDLLYYKLSDRFVYDRNKVIKLAEHLHILDRESRFSTTTHTTPWRY